MAGYRQDQFLALQVRAVRENKWYESEAAGHDVGEAAAWIAWVEEFAGAFRIAYEKNLESVLATCNARCPDGCKGVLNCDMDEKTLHEIIDLGH